MGKQASRVGSSFEHQHLKTSSFMHQKLGHKKPRSGQPSMVSVRSAKWAFSSASCIQAVPKSGNDVLYIWNPPKTIQNWSCEQGTTGLGGCQFMCKLLHINMLMNHEPSWWARRLIEPKRRLSLAIIFGSRSPGEAPLHTLGAPLATHSQKR